MREPLTSLSFRSKVILVTGGSSGIGLATARMFAMRGAGVWLVARRQDRLQTALAQVRQVSHPDQPCGAIAADVSDATQAATAVAHVTEAAGVPDIVINSAGTVLPGRFQDLDIDVFHSAMAVNYFGTLHTLKAVVPAMVARRSGHIVNVCSAGGFMGIFGYSAYSASKYAVRGLSEVLRCEMKPHGVSVSIVYPPDTDTPQLAGERLHRTPETCALSGGVVLPPDAVARSIVAGVAGRRYSITPGLEASLVYRLVGLLGDWQYPIIDHLVARAQRKTAK